MSFILDALRKSDKKRLETTAPKLDTVHAAPQPGSRPKKPLWIMLLVFVLLLNLGLLGWYLLRPQEPVVTLASPQASQGRAAETPAAAQSPSIPVAVTTRPQSSRPQPVSEPALQPQPFQRSADQQVYAISELPAEVQRRIPVLHMSLHAYNKGNPEAGMVRVNEQILRPGTALNDKFLLAEISADGAIFSFEGYRFLLPRD